ncbi:MAG TPA: tetratricopeptide repeat protein [Herpetosiphonaceae bacterium]
MVIYGTQGLYEDAIAYGNLALGLLEQHWPENIDRWCRVQLKIYTCYLGLRQLDLALQTLQAIKRRTDDPEFLYHCCYIEAMLHTRYLPQRDFARAEALLEQGLIELARTSFPESKKVFQRVFNRNGLALVRHFQGRPDEAIELCQSGYAELNAHLAPDEQKLHRSVLLYNTAQVYSSIRSYEEAIRYFAAAMQMDPNYSEYYNERGNMYLKLGRLAEAEQDYLKAIELSPPYSEVWTNLGQCCRLMGRLQEARAAYDRALDLDPAQPVPLTGRAEICEDLGLLDQALADYTASLALKPNQPLALANRAILHYQLGDLPRALEDLNQAIILAPQMPDLYGNRAVALTELGRLEEAAQDLQTYLQLSPDAEDRAEVEQKLAALRVETPVA